MGARPPFTVNSNFDTDVIPPGNHGGNVRNDVECVNDTEALRDFFVEMDSKIYFAGPWPTKSTHVDVGFAYIAFDICSAENGHSAAQAVTQYCNAGSGADVFESSLNAPLHFAIENGKADMHKTHTG